MEFLKIASNGQWSLVKAASPSNEFRGESDQDFMSYRPVSLTGELPVDHGAKGKLHNVGTTRSPKKTSNAKMQGKVPTPVQSAVVARNPGIGLE